MKTSLKELKLDENRNFYLSMVMLSSIEGIDLATITDLSLYDIIFTLINHTDPSMESTPLKQFKPLMVAKRIYEDCIESSNIMAGGEWINEVNFLNDLLINKWAELLKGIKVENEEFHYADLVYLTMTSSYDLKNRVKANNVLEVCTVQRKGDDKHYLMMKRDNSVLVFPTEFSLEFTEEGVDITFKL